MSDGRYDEIPLFVVDDMLRSVDEAGRAKEEDLGKKDWPERDAPIKNMEKSPRRYSIMSVRKQSKGDTLVAEASFQNIPLPSFVGCRMCRHSIAP